jgi:hypothetical protein
MLPLTAIALCFTLAAGFALAASHAVTRAGRAEAASAARHRFLAAFDARGGHFPAHLLVETFTTLAQRLDDGVPHGELRPGARLQADLGIGREDLEDVTLLIAARCEARLMRGGDLDALHREVETVEQLVAYLARFVVAPPAESVAPPLRVVRTA